MDVLKIRDRPLSTLLWTYYVCQQCGIVDRDENRVIVGHPCGTCAVASDGRHNYFPIAVPAIIDLMQDAFHRDPPPAASRGPLSSRDTDSQLATLIYLSTLGEVLFGNLLWELMVALELTRGVADRLFNDNPYPKQRAERLFPSLTGEKWKHALHEVSAKSGNDHTLVFKFYLSVVDARNRLLHAGDKWAIEAGMPAECMKHVESILGLFAELHNRNVRQIYNTRGKAFRLGEQPNWPLNPTAGFASRRLAPIR